MPIASLFPILLLACATQTIAPEPAAQPPPPLRAYVVRHAETADGDDPPLTAQGAARAEALRDLLADQPLAAVYSTPYQRTVQTVQPTAAAHGLEVIEYDPSGDLPAGVLAEHGGETVLISGHSNTVPALVAGLGAPQPDEIPHERYGDLWLVTHTGDQVELELGRYGD
jgi:phosphohistidine phosphatase SixA